NNYTDKRRLLQEISRRPARIFFVFSVRVLPISDFCMTKRRFGHTRGVDMSGALWYNFQALSRIGAKSRFYPGFTHPFFD
ncbi:MAG: hypothetical protein IJC25_07730, partial [Clostridia bacterium]|nr:hypothetical protein [Clostridia bacterium]